jgi:hypothetical protein
VKSPSAVSLSARKRNSSSFHLALARALALFFGGFSLLNLAGEWRLPGFDATLWWLDLRTLPLALARLLLASVAIFLIGFGVRPVMRTWRRRVTRAAAGLALFVALVNVAGFYRLLWQGDIQTGMPVPFSLFVAVAFVLILRSTLARPAALDSGCGWLRVSAGLAGCLVIFPLAQVICFGKTDYRRPADVVVVFGARVFADGTLSDALADRVRIGCQLYLDGYAEKISSPAVWATARFMRRRRCGAWPWRSGCLRTPLCSTAPDSTRRLRCETPQPCSHSRARDAFSP